MASYGSHEPMDWETSHTRYASSSNYRQIPVSHSHHQTKEKAWEIKGINCEKMLVHSTELKSMVDFGKISMEFTQTPQFTCRLKITVLNPTDTRTISEIQMLYDGLEKDVLSVALEIPKEKMKEADLLVQSKRDCLYAKVFLDEVGSKIRIHAKSSSFIDIMKKSLSFELKLDETKTSDQQLLGNTNFPVDHSKALTSTRHQVLEIPVHDVFKVSEKLCVHIYKQDLLTVKAEVIVNAANEDLKHIGGVAYSIAQEAGSLLTDDSNRITRYGPLKVTDVVTTTSGKLKSYKLVLHAVGPKWDDYMSKKNCLEDLKKTVKNVLKMSEANRFKSVAIPSISAGLFGVPKGLCGEMYALAVHEFSQENKSSQLYLQEIHFVDIDAVMLSEIKAGFEKLKAGTLFQPLEKRHPYIKWDDSSNHSKGSNTGSQSSYLSKGRQNNQTSLGTSQRPNPNSAAISRVPTSSKGVSRVTKVRKETMAGIPINVFQFKNGLEVKIYTGSIVKFHGDAIIISADEFVSGTGALGDAVKKAGGRKYEKEFQNMKQPLYSTHVTGDILICKGGDLKVHNVMHVVLNQLYDTREPKLNEYISVITNAMEKVHALSWKKVAMPLIGAGYVENNLRDLQKCCSAIFKVVSKFCFHKETTCHLKELHFINRNSKVTSTLIDNFKANCDTSDLDSQSRGIEQQPKANHSKTVKPNSAIGYSGRPEKRDHDKSALGKDIVAGHSRSFRQSASEGRFKPSNSNEGHPSSSSAAFEKHGARPKDSLRRSHSTPQAISAEKEFDMETFFQTKQSVAEKSNSEKASGNLTIIDSGTEESEEESLYEDVSSFKDKPLKSKSDEESAPCVICLSDITNGMKLDCGHEFCKECLQQSFQQHKQACPVCGTIYGIVKGNQPENGTMRVKKDRYSSLPGYEGHGTITIKYYFPNGVQGPEHPNPGQSYEGTERRGFLPDNEEGRKVLRLLQKAFERRLTFTIGHSRTTGKDNIVTWNDIHHKTKRDTGAQGFGYPDPTYLQRVQEELAAKGVTE